MPVSFAICEMSPGASGSVSSELPWAARVSTYFSDEGNRADIATVLGPYRPGRHVYACGPVRYMDSVMEAATQLGFPDSARHLEYFSVPEEPEYVNHDFTARLALSGREIAVPAQQSLSDALQEAGVKLDVKCSDGICGVCKCGLLEGEVEHRDFVLSKAQRAHEIVTCKSRAAAPNGVIVLDL